MLSMASFRPPLRCEFGAVYQGGSRHREKGNRHQDPPTTGRGARLFALKTGVGMGPPEFAWRGRERERVVEAGECVEVTHSSWNLYRLWGWAKLENKSFQSPDLHRHTNVGPQRIFLILYPPHAPDHLLSRHL